MANAITYYNDSNAVVKRVYYEGTSTVREGMPLCYNFDTTDNRTGYGAATFGAAKTEQGTTAEGEQNEGKYIRVEDPSSTNYMHFAGAVAGTEMEGQAGPCELDIFIANGAVVPVRSYSSTTTGVSQLGLTDDGTYFKLSTGDGDPMGCAVAYETVDRSSVAGLCLAKIFPTGQVINAFGAYFYPTRSSTTQGREYGVQIDGDGFFTGTTAAQSYLLEVSGSKESASTGDTYGGFIHVSGSNYGANDSNYKLYGVNCGVSNRADGTLGHIHGGNFSISLKSGSGNITTGIALLVDAQDLTAGTKTYFGGADIAINREGTAATEEFGLRLRTRGTINTAMNTVFRIDKDATDHGFINLFNIEADAVDYAACTGDVTVDTNDKVIPIVLGGDTFYLIAVDSIPAG